MVEHGSPDSLLRRNAHPLSIGSLARGRHSRSETPIATRPHKALTAHNASARKGCRRCGGSRTQVSPPNAWHCTCDIIRHTTTPAPKETTAARAATAGMSQGRALDM